MGALDNFLRRFGFARLDQYGLVLTPDDRVISTRPAILDDGLGAKIVGWREGDLAAMELDRWGSAKSAGKPIAPPASLHKLPPQAARVVAPAAPVHVVTPAPIAPTAPAVIAAPAAARPLPGVAPITAPVTAPAPIPSPVPLHAAAVAAAEEPGEDEWEWEIAMARARAAAEQVEEARVDLLGASAVIASAVIQRKTNPGMAVVAPRMPPPLPDPLPPWPETEPFNETWSKPSEVAPQVMSVMQKKLALERSTPARGASAVPPPRSTVIPVPQLPAAADPRMVRPALHSPSAQPRGRAARGTPAQQRLVDTVRTQAVQPKHEDKTSPYIELPPEVKPSGFAHTKRVAAKQR